ncbi:T-cell surface glycoprotein CD3 zeta chain [Platysternon megacephalum]|uniref:T-cell surface glycoprotein CD3 zeta chain n=1 Tax=Platysternon megacephalum TaxID=55544 RepID=A0A4D9ENC0_9SAUR|nr:T-cell surface glycoprotein CD3 zeta chain [Platysternon megacephalum]
MYVEQMDKVNTDLQHSAFVFNCKCSSVLYNKKNSVMWDNRSRNICSSQPVSYGSFVLQEAVRNKPTRDVLAWKKKKKNHKMSLDSISTFIPEGRSQIKHVHIKP